MMEPVILVVGTTDSYIENIIPVQETSYSYKFQLVYYSVPVKQESNMMDKLKVVHGVMRVNQIVKVSLE